MAFGNTTSRGPGHRQKPNGRSGACLGCSWAWSMALLGERKSRASSRRSRTSAPTGGRGRRSGTRVRGRRREKEEGADHLVCPGRRGGLGGHDPVALGHQMPQNGQAIVLECTVACSRARAWHAVAFFKRCGATTCVYGVRGDVNNACVALDAPESSWSKAGVERERERRVVQRRKWRVSPTNY